jgi:carbamoyl-phosphate synthase large subunit
MSDTPRVLVTGVGGPSGQSIMKSLAGEPVNVLVADLDPYAAGLYLVPEEGRFLLPRGEDPAFADVLLDLVRREGISVVVPTVDTELLPCAERRDEFAAAGATVVVASPQTLRTCLDKYELHKVCEGQVRVPDTVVADADFDPESVAVPVMVKPRTGSGSRGIRLIEDRATLAAVERDGTQLVQELLPGPEFSLDVIARADGAVIGVVPRERLKVDSGIAITGRTVHDPELIAYGKRVAELIGLTTVANVQVKGAVGGEPALLEVNARFPGTMPLTVAAGIDMPALAVREALGQTLPDGPLPFEEIAMVRLMGEHFMPFAEIEAMQERRP